MLDGDDSLLRRQIESTRRTSSLRRPLVCSSGKRIVQTVGILMSHSTISNCPFRRFRIHLRHYVAVLSQIQIGYLARLHYNTLVQIDGFGHVTNVILEIIVHLESVVWLMASFIIFYMFILRAKTAHLFFDIHL